MRKRIICMQRGICLGNNNQLENIKYAKRICFGVISEYFVKMQKKKKKKQKQKNKKKNTIDRVQSTVILIFR